MQLSARNQLNGKVTGVELGAVMANVKIEVSEPGVITAVITKESVEKLGLAEGDDVAAIIKSTVIVMQLSARNQLKGKVTGVELGAVMANVKIEISEPGVITAVITKESAEKLGLAEGDDVAAIIKSTEVIIGK